MVGGIALILFAILLRFFGLTILPLIFGIVGLLMALFGNSKQSELDPWESEDEQSEQNEESAFDTTLDCETEQYEYDAKADKYF
jgi:uncharacterized membrane protein